MKSVFIMSSERSGSNLLRKMLGMHLKLAGPPPPHMWHHLTTDIYKYGPLSEEKNFTKLIRNAIKMTQVPNSHLKWKHKINFKEVHDNVSHQNVSSVINTIYSLYAKKEGKTGWICKENKLYNHAFQILNSNPNAKFIYLCRDGRDVACSIKKVPTHDQHIYFIAKEWKEEQEKCLQIYQELLIEGGIILVRYEDLIETPEEELKKICEFLELEFQQGMMHFHDDESAVKEAQKTNYWKNLSKPVMSGNKGKFLKEFTKNEIKIFESLCTNILSCLGYPLYSSGAFEMNKWNKALYKVRNFVNKNIQKKKLYKEDGREERSEMLKQIHDKFNIEPLISKQLDYEEFH